MTMDRSLEPALREALDELRPHGAAPAALRSRVLAIPTTVRVESGWRRLVRPVAVPVASAGLVATAAAIAILGMATAPITLVDPVGGGEGQVPLGFDPSVEGMGLVAGVVPTAAIVGILLALAGGAAAARVFFSERASTNRGRATVVLGMLLLVLGVALARLDVGLSHGSVRAGPLNYVEDKAGVLHDEIVWISTAAPGEPTVGLVSLRNASPLPVRIEGFVVPPNNSDLIVGRPTGLWMPPGGPGYGAPSLDELRPFEPVTLQQTEELNVYLAGRAGECAFGPSFDPAAEYADGEAGGYSYIGPRITVAYSVFGLTSTAEIDIEEIFAEPTRGGCPDRT